MARLSRVRAESFDLNQTSAAPGRARSRAPQDWIDRFRLAILVEPVTVNAPPFSYGEMIHVPPHA